MKTQADPKQCFKNNYLSSQDSWRIRYLARLGISKEVQLQNNQIKNNNEKSNFNIYNSYSLGQFNLNFLSKTNQQVRNNYIKKLLINKILKIQPSKKYQSSLYYSLVIIFDWDDTIISTTYLGRVGFVQISPNIRSQLQLLDISGVNNPYFIKTYFASPRLWQHFYHNQCQRRLDLIQLKIVQSDFSRYLPKVNKVLYQNPIKIISARHGYKDKYPGDCHKWKVQAFKDVKKDFDIQLITNLICLGDSHIQMDAAHILGHQFNQPLIKTIKFKKHPSPEELIKQQELVFQRFQQIYMSIKNLTIRLQKQDQYNRKSSNKNKKTTNDE